MIKTTTAVPYSTVDLTLTAIIFAKVKSAFRNDDNETYTISIEEWREEEYSENVPDGNGGLVLENFTKTIPVRSTQRVMTFSEADQLTGILDQMFTITETGSARRKRYSILGHLLINNSENVRNTTWELV